MSGTGEMIVPSAGGAPLATGLTPPPSRATMPYTPDGPPTEEEVLVRRSEEAEAAEDAAHHRKSTEELERDAERSRERVNDSVMELRERLGLDPDAAHAHGPFAPARRHPLTVAVAAAGTATAAVIGVTVLRSHRKAEREKNAVRSAAAAGARGAVDDMIKAARRRRKAAAKATRKRRKAAGKRLDAAKEALGSAAKTADKKRRKAVRRLTH